MGESPPPPPGAFEKSTVVDTIAFFLLRTLQISYFSVVIFLVFEFSSNFAPVDSMREVSCVESKPRAWDSRSQPSLLDGPLYIRLLDHARSLTFKALNNKIVFFLNLYNLIRHFYDHIYIYIWDLYVQCIVSMGCYDCLSLSLFLSCELGCLIKSPTDLIVRRMQLIPARASDMLLKGAVFILR